MESFTKAAWVALALVHAAPAAALFVPGLIRRLYQVEPKGDLGVLLTHRGALFFAIFAACMLGAFDPLARRALTIVVSISMVSFLWIYAQAGMPAGALRTIAQVDLIGLAPLAFVLFAAWRS
jgi:hypothetical protein